MSRFMAQGISVERNRGILYHVHHAMVTGITSILNTMADTRGRVLLRRAVGTRIRGLLTGANGSAVRSSPPFWNHRGSVA